ncbi:hypothetical protein RJ641_007601 [Dillenia turbinata]|uniref:Uncharacterized protein n=1 Tax=Dillenia turbinata TaxID=194707 RepID=A0AAN8VAM3_9MAGN
MNFRPRENKDEFTIMPSEYPISLSPSLTSLLSFFNPGPSVTKPPFLLPLFLVTASELSSSFLK